MSVQFGFHSLLIYLQFLHDSIIAIGFFKLGHSILSFSPWDFVFHDHLPCLLLINVQYLLDDFSFPFSEESMLFFEFPFDFLYLQLKDGFHLFLIMLFNQLGTILAFRVIRFGEFLL